MALRMPFFEVRLEGQDITPWIDSASVVEDDRQADNVTLAVSDPRMIYADALFEGSVVEVDMGYAEPNQHALLLRATITKVELSYPSNGVPSLTLKGEDKSICMGLEEKKKKWSDRKVSDIVREVAAPYGYADVQVQLDPDPMIERRPIHQDSKTDLAFLQELASRHHAKCFVELDERGREVLYFIPERAVLRARRADRLIMSYRMGPESNLISFSPQFNASYLDRLKQIHDVDEDGNQIQNQQRPPGEIFVWELNPVRMSQASPRDRDRIQRLYEVGAARKRELQRQLAARRTVSGEVALDQADMESTNDSLQSRQLGMTASGSARGNIWLRAKSVIVAEGVGERFRGEWYVSNVTHRIDQNGYKTDFQCVR